MLPSNLLYDNKVLHVKYAKNPGRFYPGRFTSLTYGGESLNHVTTMYMSAEVVKIIHLRQ